jgi:hypothetical protein
MKFLKQQNTSRWSVSDNTFFTNQYGRAVMDLRGALRLPKGTTAERPNTTGVRTPEGPNGFIRYNTTLNSIEAYIAGVWQTVAAPGVSAITKQTLGPGDGTTTIFGPLSINPPSEDSIICLVENVFQISDNNFNLLYNYLGSGNTYIEFTSPVPVAKDITIFYGYV